MWTKLEMKEQRQLRRDWSSTKRSLNLSCGWLTKKISTVWVFSDVQIWWDAGNNIGEEGGRAIVEALKTNKTLVELDLDYLNLKSTDLSYFICVFVINATTLTTPSLLPLRWTSLSERLMKTWACMVQELMTLRQAWLRTDSFRTRQSRRLIFQVLHTKKMYQAIKWVSLLRKWNHSLWRKCDHQRTCVQHHCWGSRY